MKAVFKKGVQGSVMSALAFALPALIEPEILRQPHLPILIAVGAVATIFQPAYDPTEGSRTPEDRGTALQIVWSIYLCNQLALLEAVLFRWPEAVSWDSMAFGALTLLLSGLALRSWSVVVLGRWFTWHVQVQDQQQIVRAGPYRWVRHPSYTGALLSYLALPLLFHAWFTAALALVLLPLAFARRIRHEEQLLRTSLEGYEDYASEVKALVPGLF